jgi:hypothetical protein
LTDRNTQAFKVSSPSPSLEKERGTGGEEIKIGRLKMPPPLPLSIFNPIEGVRLKETRRTPEKPSAEMVKRYRFFH